MYLELRQNIGKFLISDNKASKKQQEENNNQLYDMIKAVYIEEFKDFLKNILKETNSVFLNGFSIKMHKFLRAVGFSKVSDRAKLKKIKDYVRLKCCCSDFHKLNQRSNTIYGHSRF